jgi:hypothetical protein
MYNRCWPSEPKIKMFWLVKPKTCDYFAFWSHCCIEFWYYSWCYHLHTQFCIIIHWFCNVGGLSVKHVFAKELWFSQKSCCACQPFRNDLSSPTHECVTWGRTFDVTCAISSFLHFFYPPVRRALRVYFLLLLLVRIAISQIKAF